MQQRLSVPCLWQRWPRTAFSSVHMGVSLRPTASVYVSLRRWLAMRAYATNPPLSTWACQPLSLSSTTSMSPLTRGVVSAPLTVRTLASSSSLLPPSSAATAELRPEDQRGLVSNLLQAHHAQSTDTLTILQLLIRLFPHAEELSSKQLRAATTVAAMWQLWPVVVALLPHLHHTKVGADMQVLCYSHALKIQVK